MRLLDCTPRNEPHVPRVTNVCLCLSSLSSLSSLLSSSEPFSSFIAVSTSGKAADVIKAVTIAKRYGAKVIAVTKPKSRLAALADIALCVHVPEAPDALKPTEKTLSRSEIYKHTFPARSVTAVEITCAPA